MAEQTPTTPARVWDAPTRVFHWLLVVSILGAWLTRNPRYTDYHVFFGYTVGALVVFRLAWGLVGGRWARFSSFAYSPLAALKYLADLVRGRPRHYTGHNPAGSWAIYLLLAFAASIVVSGLLELGGEKRLGPLNGMISFAAGDAAAEIHEVLAWTMLAVIGAHILGVVVGSFSDRENLVLSMVTGIKRVAASDAAPATFAAVATAMAVLLIAAAGWYFRGHLGTPAGQAYIPFTGATLAMDSRWDNECGSCHLAYHPSLLPERSWKALLAKQDEHFGEDLALSEDTVAALGAYASANSAEHLVSPVSWKILSTTPKDATPLRITDTEYWKHEHEDLTDADFVKVKKIDCAGCHLDADRGTFAPGAMDVGAGIKPPAPNKPK